MRSLINFVINLHDCNDLFGDQSFSSRGVMEFYFIRLVTPP